MPVSLSDVLLCLEPEFRGENEGLCDDGPKKEILTLQTSFDALEAGGF